MSRLSHLVFAAFIALLMAFSLQSCYKTVYYSGPVDLRFSSDTLVFDTVFTTVGSATRILKIYNDHDKAIEISSISLEKAGQSKFRLNIDGSPGYESEYIEIAANDSIYIFGEVTIDPDEPLSESPFVIQDQLVFDVNGRKQLVQLEAWGQNANYLPGKFAKGKVYLTTCDMGSISWDDPKPYVIYGTLLIDSCTLHIPKGTNVFVHGGFARAESGQEYNDGQLYFLKEGKLLIEGTVEEPVLFQTDRLEHDYDDISGLWSGIYFVEGSSGNKIEHAILKNANIGIFLDSASTLDISYSRILHNISAGIYARHAEVKALNCLIADSGAYGLSFRYGGNYQLDHCTVANYNNQQEALYMGNYKCLDNLCSELALNPVSSVFRNCIFYGNGADELFFEDATFGEDPLAFSYEFSNCLLAVDEQIEADGFQDFFENCLNCFNGEGEENLFIDIDQYNFKPDSNAIVINTGIFLPEITDDIEGNLRDGEPDIGCFEFH